MNSASVCSPTEEITPAVMSARLITSGTTHASDQPRGRFDVMFLNIQSGSVLAFYADLCMVIQNRYDHPNTAYAPTIQMPKVVASAESLITLGF